MCLGWMEEELNIAEPLLADYGLFMCCAIWAGYETV